MATQALTKETATAYARDLIDGARIAWAHPVTIDGIACMNVKAWSRGYAFIVTVWLECGALYGEY